MRRLLWALVCALLWSAPARAQVDPPPGQEPTPDLTELVNAMLGGAMGGPVDEKGLQKDVEEAGGVPFRRDVPVDFLNRQQLRQYLGELFDEEYPKEQALVDERLLRAFDLLPAGTDLRALRAKVLEDNVAGFYDERPGKRRLYSVSEDRTFTPMNQIVLAHEMRHALQDQYADLHDLVTGNVSDFDDRRLAVMALFEGDATLVMERFVKLRLGVLGAGVAEAADDEAGLAGGMADVPGAPPVVRDQLVQPYVVGLTFARAVFARGGGSALREAWGRPPQSSEQVLHPDLYFSGERPRSVRPRVDGPSGGRVLAQGVLGELLMRTLLEDGQEAAAAGWGGDGWKLWDAQGRTLLSWRSEWDTPGDASEFHDALLRRFTRLHGAAQARGGWTRFGGGWSFAVRRDGDAIELVSADDAALLDGVLGGSRGATAELADETLDIVGGPDRVPVAASDTQETTADAESHDLGQGDSMATSTPPGNQTNLGMAPNMAGLLCYVPCCIGLVFSVVVAIVEKQSRFVRFHAFQSLLLHAIAIVFGIGLQVVNAVLAIAGIPFLPMLVSLLGMVVLFGWLGVTIFLMIKANGGEELELPVIGALAKGWA